MKNTSPILCNLVMLPTDKAFPLCLFDKKLYWMTAGAGRLNNDTYRNQHIYAISSIRTESNPNGQDLSVGDYVYHKGSRGDIYFANTGTPNDFIDTVISIEDGIAKCGRFEFALSHPSVFKVVASTDKNLITIPRLPLIDKIIIDWYIGQHNETGISNYELDKEFYLNALADNSAVLTLKKEENALDLLKELYNDYKAIVNTSWAQVPSQSPLTNRIETFLNTQL